MRTGSHRPWVPSGGVARRRLPVPALIGIVLVVAGAMVPALSIKPASAAPPPPGVDPRIVVIGDSVILGARGAIVGRLAGWSVTFDARESLSTVGAVSVIDQHRAGLGSIVVVALGNNDGATPSILSPRVDAVMQALSGAPRVIWVNLRNFRDWVPAANAVLADAAARWPNLEIADWHALATPRPDLVAGDGIHLGPAGAAAMADLVGRHVDAAAARLAPPPSTRAAQTERAQVRARREQPVSAAQLSPPRPLIDVVALVALALAPLAVATLGIHAAAGSWVSPRKP